MGIHPDICAIHERVIGRVEFGGCFRWFYKGLLSERAIGRVELEGDFSWRGKGLSIRVCIDVLCLDGCGERKRVHF